MSFDQLSVVAELRKTKNSFALWFTILAAGFVPAFVLLIYSKRWSYMIPPKGMNPWDLLFQGAWKANSFMLALFFTVLIASLLLNIEHKNNTWKVLFTLPVSKGRIYLDKLCVLLMFLLAYYVLFVVFTLGAGLILGLIWPQLKFLQLAPDLPHLGLLLIRSFVSSLAVLAIHFWLSFRVRNMIVPIGLACILFVVFFSLLQSRWEWVIYFPYSFNYISIVKVDFAKDVQYGPFLKHELISVVYFVVVSAASFWDFTRWYKAK